MKTLNCTILAMLLTSCSTAPHFKHKVVNYKAKIEIIITDDLDITNNGSVIIGKWKQIGDTHYLYLPSIRWLHDPEMWCVWGHELGHVVFEFFHNKHNSNTCF